MVITHNLPAMNSNRQLGITTSNSAKSSEKLASGYKINRAADDAAGLSISEKMRRQVRGLDRATDNSYDGISLVQIADGAMAEVHDMLQRANELSIQAANGTMSYGDRMDCQREINKIKNEIDAIHDRTKFNEIPVLQGYKVETDGKMLMPERTETETIYETIIKKLPISGSGNQTTGTDLPQWLLDGFDQSSLNAGVLNSIYNDGNIDRVAAYIDFSGFNPSKVMELDGKGFYTTCCSCNRRFSIEFDGYMDEYIQPDPKDLHYAYTVGIKSAKTAEDIIDRIIQATSFNGKPGKPQGHYTDFIKDGNKLIIADMGPYPGRQPDKNLGEGLFGPGVVRAYKVERTHVAKKKEVTKPPVYEKIETYQHGSLPIHAGADADMVNKILIELPYVSSEALGINKVDVTAMGGAEDSINKMGDAIAYVSAERSRMGAYQNRLEHTVRNLGNVVENSTAAESRIRDTDIAEEMVKKSMQNILMNAGQSMLAQANQTTNGVMALLNG